MCSSYTISGLMPGGDRAARHSLADRLAACGNAGYDGAWMHFRDYREQRSQGLDDDAIRAAFDENGLALRGIEFLANWFLAGEAARDDLATCLAAARAIGADVISVGGDFADTGIGRAAMVRSFRDLCARAGENGISVALEFVPWSNIPDIAAALEFLGPANAGLMVDCWHLFRGGMSVADVATVPPGGILGIQVNDAARVPAAPLPVDTQNRRPCGEGAFDLEGFAKALDRAEATAPYASRSYRRNSSNCRSRSQPAAVSTPRAPCSDRATHPA